MPRTTQYGSATAGTRAQDFRIIEANIDHHHAPSLDVSHPNPALEPRRDRRRHAPAIPLSASAGGVTEQRDFRFDARHA